MPTPFEVAYEARVKDYDLAERMIHKELDWHRVNPEREFFEISLEQAIKVVSEVAEEMAE